MPPENSPNRFLPDDLVAVGEITTAFGIRGEAKMRPMMDSPETLAKLPSVVLRWADGSQPDENRKVAKVRPGELNLIVRFDGIADRNEAERLRGATLFIRRDQLPPLEPDAYYETDLLGLSVATETGKDLGVIERVLFMPANDVYETALAMIPAVDTVVVSVDLPSGKMTVRDMPGLRKDE